MQQAQEQETAKIAKASCDIPEGKGASRSARPGRPFGMCRAGLVRYE